MCLPLNSALYAVGSKPILGLPKCCVCFVGLRNLLAQLTAPAITSGTAPSHCHQLCILTAWTLPGALNRSDDFLETFPVPSSLPKDKRGSGSRGRWLTVQGTPASQTHTSSSRHHMLGTWADPQSTADVGHGWAAR